MKERWVWIMLRPVARDAPNSPPLGRPPLSKGISSSDEDMAMIELCSMGRGD